MVMGRPERPITKEEREILIEMGIKGQHVIQFCASIGISEKHFYNKLKVDEELQADYEIYKAHAASWWLKLNQESAQESSKKHDNALIIFNTRNRIRSFELAPKEDQDSASVDPLNIQFNVADAKAEIKITKGKGKGEDE